MARNIYSLSIFLFALAFSLEARAQFFTGPAASGAGGAGRAAVDLGESSFLNPAAVAFIQRYNVTGIYGISYHPAIGNVNEYAASIADGTSESLIPGALTYVRRHTDNPNGVGDTQQDIQLSIAGTPIRKVAFGVAGHRMTDSVSTAIGGNDYEQWNMHVGAIYVPVESVGIGVVAYDILPGTSAPVGVHLVVPTFALGVNYVYQKIFRARLDFVRPDTNNDGRRINVMTGLETVFGEYFVLRLGSEWRETADQNYLTVGLGYKGPRLSFDYSFQKDVRTADNYRHLIDLWLAL